MKKILNANGISFTYNTIGEGFPCIMIHGNRDSKEVFTEMAQLLQETIGGKYYMFDLRGHGDSEKAIDGYSIDDFVMDIKSIIQELGYQSVNYIGHSLGSTIGIRFASQYPNMINKLILMSGAATFKIGFKRPTFTRENFRSQLMETNQRAANYFFHKDYPLVQKRITDNWLNIDYDVHLKMINLQHPDLRNDAANIKNPVLLLYGEDDRSTNVSDGEMLKSLIPDAKLSIIKNGSHFMFLEHPLKTIFYIGGFLYEEGV